jgi:hypothetical protein
MNLNTRTLSIGLVSILLLAGVFYVIWPRDGGTNWRETYDTKSSQPYGLQVVSKLLERKAGNAFQVIDDSLYLQVAGKEGQTASYVFIGEGLWLDSLSRDHLLDFVQAGNVAFLSTMTIPYDLLDSIYRPICEEEFDAWDYDYLYRSEVGLNFVHPDIRLDSSLQVKFRNRNRWLNYSWTFIDLEAWCFDDYSTVRLGTFDEEYINYIEVPYGEGRFLLHSTPLVFSNFILKNERSWPYVDGALGYLPDGPIYFDEFNGISAMLARQLNDPFQRPGKSFSTEGPLQYVLSQPSLAWAWYLGLALVLLYLLFRAKRRQRIIPVLEPNRNTSLEFIATIGQLYFQQNNHRKLALQKMQLLLAYVRERYGVATNELDDDFVSRLAERSNVEPEVLRKMFVLYKNIQTSNYLSESTLIDLHKLTDHFYQHCK